MFIGAAFGASANPLIGTWHLSGETPLANAPNVHCQITQIVFTPTSTTAFDPKQNPTLAATYNISAQRVVVTSEGGDVIYFLKGADHIQRDDWFKCTYSRVK
jgi:hypothetical protein